MAAAKARQILAIVATDSTFARQTVRGEVMWVGKCIHCSARLVVALDGAAPSGTTVEHIVPKHHGGTEALENVALACARCNAGKGVRLDGRRRDDSALVAVIERLTARRRERWREP